MDNTTITLGDIIDNIPEIANYKCSIFTFHPQNQIVKIKGIFYEVRMFSFYSIKPENNISFKEYVKREKLESTALILSKDIKIDLKILFFAINTLDTYVLLSIMQL